MSEPNTQDYANRDDSGSNTGAPTINPQPATPVPPAPAGPTSAQPTPATPVTPTSPAQPVAQPPDPHQLRRSIFDGVLRTLSGAPQYVNRTDPQTGEVTRVPVQQTRGQLGKSILAGALAGMFSGMGARDPEGRPDPMKAASEGFKAGTELHERQQQQAQQIEDENFARRQMTMKSNLDLAHQTLALNQSKQNMFEKIAGNNQNGILKDAKSYDDSLTDPSQLKAILKTGLSHDEALAALKGHWSDQLAQIDGYQQTENGDIVPTFTILNPSVRVKLNESQAKEFARFNPQFATAWDQTGGNIPLGLHQYADATHKLNTLDHMESVFKDEATQLGLKPDFDFAATVRQKPQVFSAILQSENALAGGGSPVDALRRIATDPNGSVVLHAMGVTSQQVEDLYQKQIREQKEAQAVGDKAPADPETLAQIPTLAKNLGLSPAEVAAASAELPKTGATRADVAKVLENIRHQHDTNLEHPPTPVGGITVPKGFTPNPNAPQMDSVDLQKDLQGKGVKLPSNFEALYAVAHNAADLKTLPSRPTKGTGQMSEQEGLSFIRQYINPQYQEGDYAAASSLSKELASTRQGTAGGSLLSAGVASNHLDLLEQAATALDNHDTQALNHVANALGVQFGKSPAVTFQAIADQVNQEVGKVVAGGTPHEAELDALRKNLNTDQSPEQTRNVIKSYIGLMSGRVGEINERSQQYFGRDVKGVSPSVARVFAKYGFDVPGYVRVQVNGVTGAIPKNQLNAFKKKYPNAAIGGQ